MDWKECFDKRIVKDVKQDEELISSLKKTSDNKLKSSDLLSLSTTTANSKFILAYDSLREILEALALKNRYKIYNHECYSPFLKEILNESEKGDEFDEIRKARNSVNYYGQEIAIQEAETMILRIKVLRTYLLKLLIL